MNFILSQLKIWSAESDSIHLQNEPAVGSAEFSVETAEFSADLSENCSEPKSTEFLQIFCRFLLVFCRFFCRFFTIFCRFFCKNSVLQPVCRKVCSFHRKLCRSNRRFILQMDTVTFCRPNFQLGSQMNEIQRGHNKLSNFLCKLIRRSSV